MDRGAWQATVHGFAESDMTGQARVCTYMHRTATVYWGREGRNGHRRVEILWKKKGRLFTEGQFRVSFLRERYLFFVHAQSGKSDIYFETLKMSRNWCKGAWREIWVERWNAFVGETESLSPYLYEAALPFIESSFFLIVKIIDSIFEVLWKFWRKPWRLLPQISYCPHILIAVVTEIHYTFLSVLYFWYISLQNNSIHN